MGKSLVLAQGRIKLIDITEQGKSISLLNQADYALSERRCKTLADVQHLDWHLLNDSVTAKKEFEFSVLQYWIHFSTHSAFTRDSTLLLKFDSKMQHTQLFERIGDKLVLIGQTGFGSKTSALSIANDYWRIYLPLKSQKTQDFYVLIKKHQYNIVPQYPKIETYDTAYRELNNELILFPLSFKNIKLWFAGFYFTVFIYCCLKFFFQRKNIAYLYYALASIAWFFRYSLQADAIILETDWLPKLNNNFIFYLSFVPQNFFYILFLGKFLKANENKYLNIYLKCCLWFWGFMVVVIVVHYFRPELTPITKTIWIYNALPVLVLTLWLAYHARPKPNQGYLRFAFLGLLTISIALIFSVVPKWLNIANLPAWYYAVNSYVDLVTLAFAVDAILFLTALAYSDRLDELERINLKIKNAENEHKILRLQMNPHFIFNCLNSINLYIEQNNSELASSYLSKFSQLMRLSLSHSRKDKIVLSEEIKTIKLYLEMETMRFKGKLKYTFEIDDDVDTDFIEIPPMLVQPYIENAIWHGLMHKNDGGEIRINISQDFKQQTLLISIKDDGIGRLKAAELNSKDVEKEKSYGTLITGERIANFNKEFNTNTQIRIEDLYGENNEANGTMVLISIHLI
ncbi:sensor histidine kinase [Pedobacter sp. UBA5917]|uniref:sensor histidine kinase n=1 Tax=Pedobacter sp. UBA5917 TaxID=1947061 RepID=UPI0025F1BE1D|nr:histidine kinase [Pedobacter sp. UBA5917]